MTRREKLSEIASELRAKKEWIVGRTDMQSHTQDGVPEHYAYPPNDGMRIRFTADDPDDALGMALAFAEYMNRPNRTLPDCEVIADVRPIDFKQNS